MPWPMQVCGVQLLLFVLSRQVVLTMDLDHGGTSQVGSVALELTHLPILQWGEGNRGIPDHREEDNASQA